MIIVSITAPTVARALREAKEAERKGAHLIEFRIDLMPGLTGKGLKRLLRGRADHSLVTNRTVRERGKFPGTEEQRVSLLVKAVRLGTAFVDVEHSTRTDLKNRVFKEALARGTTVIHSWHDFEGTPSTKFLMAKARKMARPGHGVLKLVTMAMKTEHAERMLSLIPRIKRFGLPVIAMAMGELGQETHKESVPRGAMATFGSLQKDKEAAPGQVPVGELKAHLEKRGFYVKPVWKW